MSKEKDRHIQDEKSIPERDFHAQHHSHSEEGSIRGEFKRRKDEDRHWHRSKNLPFYPPKIDNHLLEKFYVITVISNPIRYKSRYNLYQKFRQHVLDLGGKLITVELAFGNRGFQITDRDNPFHVQLRTDQELWHKENAINVGINYLSQLDPDWQYVAWIDADIHFSRNDIFLETIQQLQHYEIVQMFSHAIDLNPNEEPIATHNGFMWSYLQNDRYPPQGPGQGGYYNQSKGFWHPGYAWAAKRRALDKLPLLEHAAMGAGDHHMALSLIGCAEKSLPGGISKGYRHAVMNWQHVALSEYRKNVGYVPGTLMHSWHGRKADRKYKERWDILTKNNFDPYTDLVKDSQGLHKLNMNYGERSIRIRDDFRAYFRQRSEDDLYTGD